LCALVGAVGCAEAEANSDDWAGLDALDVASPETAADPAKPLAQVSSSCSGNKPGRRVGRSNQALIAGLGVRNFVYYAPPNLDPNTPAPMLIVPHGYTMSGEQMFGITNFHRLADQEGFVVAYPDGGVGVGPWNVGAGICGAGAFVNGNNNDQAFVDKMIEFAEADRCIDREHVFMAGFSMGGYFSNETGCRNPNVKAIAPHSGGTHNLNSCLPRKLPVLIMHYDPDLLIAYSCGVDARNKWAQRNGCSLAAPRVERLPNGRCEYYNDCQNGQVAMCTFNSPLLGGGELLAGHGWAGGAKPLLGGSFAISGPSSATEISWNFFKQYAW
jgi:polyhydroxybutyrate depolymerase